MNPIKKVKHEIRNRKRKKRWKKLRKNVGYVALDVWNIASHVTAMPTGENTDAPEIIPTAGFSLVINQDP